MMTRAIAVVVAVLLVCGCASLHKATSLNGLDLSGNNKTNVGHYNAKNWGLYLLGIPLITGDTEKVSDITEKGLTINSVFLKNTVNLDSVAEMLTRTAKKDGATIVEDMVSGRSNAYIFPVFFIRSISMSANGVK
jgi:uncharacterized protein YceK